mgnify:CR=1 FL=1
MAETRPEKAASIFARRNAPIYHLNPMPINLSVGRGGDAGDRHALQLLNGQPVEGQFHDAIIARAAHQL